MLPSGSVCAHAPITAPQLPWKGLNLKENSNIKIVCYKKWSFHVYSDGWRHFLVCISSASENMHKCATTSWSSCLWKLWWAGVKHWRTAPHRFYVYRKPISSPRPRNLKVIKKMCTFEVHLCMMYGQLILSGKPFKHIFHDHGKVKILQLRLTLTPLSNQGSYYINPCYHAWHAFFSLTIFPPWSVIGVFCFILVTLDLCLLLIHRYLWNSQKWQILISVNRDLDFFYFLRFVSSWHRHLFLVKKIYLDTIYMYISRKANPWFDPYS